MKSHAMTWPQVQKMLERVHEIYEVETHRPQALVVFYEHEGAWAASAVLNGEFHPLSAAQARDIVEIMKRDEPGEPMAEA